MSENKIEQSHGFELIVCTDDLELIVQFFLGIEERSLFVRVINIRDGRYIASTGYDFALCEFIRDCLFVTKIDVCGKLRKNGDVVGEIEISLSEIVIGLREFNIKMGLGVEQNHIDALDDLLLKAIEMESKQ